MSPQLSRRDALKWMGAGLVLAPQALRGADRSLPRTSFLVISDTHLGYRDQTAAEEQWKKVAAELARAPEKRILHLGDVVDGGREPQYAVYRKIRETIGKEVHEIPGNHDPVELFEKHLRTPIDTAIEHDWLRLLLVGNTRFGDHDGFLTEKQTDWLNEQCGIAKRQSQFVIFCMHVPAHENKHPDRGWYIKRDHGGSSLQDVIERHRDRIVALFHGHFHNGIRGWSDRSAVHEVVFPSALYNQDRRLEAQKAPGYNLAEFRPGYTRVVLENGLLKLTYQVAGHGDSEGKELPVTQVR